MGVAATDDVNASAMTKLEACGQFLPPDSQFVMELSANWNTKPNPKPGEKFELSFTYGDKNRPELVGDVPDEHMPFYHCLMMALIHDRFDLLDDLPERYKPAS